MLTKLVSLHVQMVNITTMELVPLVILHVSGVLLLLITVTNVSKDGS